ncbi:hypothetical protein [Flavobacterium oreochromis]|uniref:hypothetical protein n=1 Tax=Flavobacterium oreochromis TaxID=2906078 RepID=UPI00385FA777
MEQTFGQQAVGYILTEGLKTSEIQKVSEVKKTFSELIDVVNSIEVKSYLGNTLKGMAIRSCIETSSIVVKILTHRENN